MKKLLYSISFVSIFAASIFADDGKLNYKLDDLRNCFGLSWTTDSNEVLQYATNVGYTNIMYSKGMEKNPLSNGKYFFLETPEYHCFPRSVNLKRTYSPEQIAKWESLCVVAFPEKPFPDNLAKSWWHNKYNVGLQLDMQQKKVQDYAINWIADKIKTIEKRNPSFKFGGLSWDVSRPDVKFFEYRERAYGACVKGVKLADWTGGDYSPLRPGITHEYPTFTGGYYEFYRRLFEAMRKINPDAIFITEPTDIYKTAIREYEKDYFLDKDVEKYLFNFYLDEAGGTKFVENEKNFMGGKIKKNMVGNSSPHLYSDSQMRNVAAMAAINGAWTTFYGRYGGYNISPLFRSIRDIPARIKLGKLVANWENLNNTPLSLRKYENGIYTSPTAYMSKDVYWAIQPARNRMIFVFITPDGEVKIPDGYELGKIHELDGLFSEAGILGKKVLKVSGNSIKPYEPCFTNCAFAVELKKIENAQ